MGDSLASSTPSSVCSGDDSATCPTCGRPSEEHRNQQQAKSSTPKHARSESSLSELDSASILAATMALARKKPTTTKPRSKPKPACEKPVLTPETVYELHVKIVGEALLKADRRKWARTITKQLGGLIGLQTSTRARIAALRAPGGAQIPNVLVGRLIRVFKTRPLSKA